MTWRAILDGDDAARARAIIAEIADSLAVPRGIDSSLCTGSAGVALLHGYRALDGDEASADRAVDALAHSLEHVMTNPEPALFTGYGGIGFVAQHLVPVLGEVEALEQLDSLIVDATPSEYELCAGLVGLGVYRRERGLPIEPVVAQLAARVERTAAGLTWRTPPPYDGFNLGVAHGVAGVVAFLADADEPALLRGALDWLLAQRRAAVPEMPMTIDRTIVPEYRYDGWCYGDASAAVALVRAGAIDVGRALARRDAALSTLDLPDFTIDRSLCHGSISRAHLFNRLGQALDDDTLLEAARRWYRETLVGDWRDLGPGLQIGAAGIALGLLAGCSTVAPAWDRALLLSGRAP